MKNKKKLIIPLVFIAGAAVVISQYLQQQVYEDLNIIFRVVLSENIEPEEYVALGTPSTGPG